MRGEVPSNPRLETPSDHQRLVSVSLSHCPTFVHGTQRKLNFPKCVMILRLLMVTLRAKTQQLG